MNLREKILAAADRPLEKVAVPEWGVDVYLRPMSLGASRQVFAEEDAAKRAALLLVHHCCDQDGAAIFTAEDAAALLDKGATPCSRLLIRINAIGEADGITAAGEGSGATAASETSIP